MRMDPRERLETFDPQYVTGETIEWLEGLSAAEPRSLARRLNGTDALRYAARRGLTAKALGGLVGAEVEFRRDSGDFAMKPILHNWLAELIESVAQGDDVPLDRGRRAVGEIAVNVQEALARLRQIGMLLYDVHGHVV